MRCNLVEVEFSRKVNPAQYEDVTAKATIKYMPDDENEVIDVDAALETAFDLAQKHVLSRVGLIPKGSAPAKDSTLLAAAKANTVKAKAAAKPKAKAAAAVVEEEDDIVPTKAPAKAKAKAKAKPKASAAVIEDEDDGPEVISDGEMIKAVTAKVAELQEAGQEDASDLLKEQIKAFNPNPGSPFKLADIDQKSRPKFLDLISKLGVAEAEF